ncbi:dual specificity protein phosphatase 3-like isoform X2 [Phymastichus coffea]|uniref:dual specificity protein phosphatase 3-like isoform X2 n=1 Tax=Phymastichus coffea TaxID=108790 RepID=UPI00273B9F51|nr:dual specificity protein phosphatase 3-like isoform X2 [Phymastichus coffea]
MEHRTYSYTSRVPEDHFHFTIAFPELFRRRVMAVSQSTRTFSAKRKKKAWSQRSTVKSHMANAALPQTLAVRFQDFQKQLPGGETSMDNLLDALRTTKTDFKRLPGFDPNVDEDEYHRAQQCIDCDEVFPRVYIGDGLTAKNKEYLLRIGITHVLNAAEGKAFGMVNTDSNYYKDTNVKYLGLQIKDRLSMDISQYFYTAASFIQDACASGGRVFVHCVQGVSRSATCVIAYLMIKKAMLAKDAIRTVRLSREIGPNEGFLRQLAHLDNQLRRQRM